MILLQCGPSVFGLGVGWYNVGAYLTEKGFPDMSCYNCIQTCQDELGHIFQITLVALQAHRVRIRWLWVPNCTLKGFWHFTTIQVHHHPCLQLKCRKATTTRSQREQHVISLPLHTLGHQSYVYRKHRANHAHYRRDWSTTATMVVSINRRPENHAQNTIILSQGAQKRDP